MSSAIMPTYARIDVAFERGEGIHLFTADGEEYIDFGGGIAVNALGHSHPHLVEALAGQAGKLWHTSNLYRIPEGERLAGRLCDATFADQVFFTNSGAEAMECCIKTARKHHAHNGRPERYRVITFDGAFHGRTLATIAAGGKADHLAGFGPATDGFDKAVVGDMASVAAAAGPETAAVLIEPVQGEGGIRVVSSAFLKQLREFCDENGLLLIFDEVQCGVGRTGKLFAHEWAGVAPDIMGAAKAIGGGFPMGACLATAAAADGMTAGTHGSTYGGNPLAMAVGNAVLDVVQSDGFLDRVARMGLLFSQKLARLKDEYPGVIEEVRGKGLMIGLKCAIPCGEVVKACHDQHLLSVPAGDNVVRLLPPLIVTEQEIEEATGRLERALAGVAAAAGA